VSGGVSGTESYSIENRVGRLLEVRLKGSPSVREASTLDDEIQRLKLRQPAPWVTAVDERRSGVMNDQAAQAIIELMRKQNASTERAGKLLGQQALFGVQVEALVLAARNPDRRVFRDRAELEQWLGESLTDAERTRLHEFLDEGER
jgi:hypothetical protein